MDPSCPVHRRGRSDCIAFTYEQTHRIVFTLIFRITKDRETAEELTIDVFHGVWRKASGYDPSGRAVVGWIMNQARSRAIDRVRFEQRKKRVNGYADEPVTASPMKDAQQVCQLAEETQLVWSETGCTCVVITSTEDDTL